ncbi:hypothetical protein PSECIP111951_03452 [Pseudoalteromonas holothuriae]|uniref:Magnesium transporter MgtE intracellular domain-containing protein n=1 Tax=Pseudoalteromonas holothuriae TaxID=2963714 RepID=A0ABM9GLY6_9GAMM|nr:hypothetical protein [Pseudoalteromonas sp. CIP111951]CAH9065853.1 hypothetical protein PSECIP111951_03452 [Pseudoalteromonas sp. CIP111951]
MTQAMVALTLHFLESETTAAARKLELVNIEHAAEVLALAPPQTAVKVLKSMIASVAAKLLIHLPEAQIKLLVNTMELADLASILRHTEKPLQDSFINQLPPRKQPLSRMLVAYPEYTIGSMIETNVLVADSHMKVEELLIRLKSRQYTYLQWVYVVNKNKILQGTVFIGDILQSEQQIRVNTLIKHKPTSIRASMDLNSTMQLELWKHHDCVAVENKQKEFMGVLHYSKLRRFKTVSNEGNSKITSISEDLFGVYGDTIASMVELTQPINAASSKIKKA